MDTYKCVTLEWALKYKQTEFIDKINVNLELQIRRIRSKGYNQQNLLLDSEREDEFEWVFVSINKEAGSLDKLEIEPKKKLTLKKTVDSHRIQSTEKIIKSIMQMRVDLK